MEFSNIISFLALMVAAGSLYVSIKNKKSSEKWREHDVIKKEESDYREKAKPYFALINDTYHDIEDILSDYSTKANEAFNLITDYSDKLDNGNNTKKHALRHHLAYSIYEVVEKFEEETLFQSPEYLFSTKMNQYRKLDYKLDLHQENLATAENHLKVLYEHINDSERMDFSNFSEKTLDEVYKVYFDNQRVIDNHIKTLEKEYVAFIRYDFGNTYDPLHKDMKELLNILKYIKYTSQYHPFYCDKTFTEVSISHIFYNTANVMIINDGVMKLTRLIKGL